METNITSSHPQIKKSIISLRIIEIINYVFAFILGPLFIFVILSSAGPNESYIAGIIFGILNFVISLTMGIFTNVVIRKLKQKKYWAWIVAIIISIIYIPNAFMLLGVISLIGLFDKDVKEVFQAQKK